MVTRILNNDFFKVLTGKYNGEQSKSNATDDKKCQWIDKEEEIFVISLPNTIVHPWTVMIEIL